MHSARAAASWRRCPGLPVCAKSEKSTPLHLACAAGRDLPVTCWDHCIPLFCPPSRLRVRPPALRAYSQGFRLSEVLCRCLAPDLLCPCFTLLLHACYKDCMGRTRIGFTDPPEKQNCHPSHWQRLVLTGLPAEKSELETCKAHRRRKYLTPLMSAQKDETAVWFCFEKLDTCEA